MPSTMLRGLLLTMVVLSGIGASQADLNNSDAIAFVRQGQQLAARGEHAAAIAAYDRAMAQDPNCAPAYAWKASSLLAAGRVDAAERAIAQALSLEDRQAIFHVIAGRVQVAQNKVEQARQSYDRAATLSPGKAGAFYADLASLLTARHDDRLNPSIESALKAAADANPPSLDALFTLGQSYVSAGKPEGRQYLQRYLDASHNLPEDLRDARKMQLAQQMIRAMDILRQEQ